jgi:hypothetical protein
LQQMECAEYNKSIAKTCAKLRHHDILKHTDLLKKSWNSAILFNNT